MKILDVYARGQVTQDEVKNVWPGASLESLHVSQLPTKVLEGYDIIILNNSLMFFAPNEVPKIVKRAADALNPRGELWMITPSLEWAANSIVYGHESPALQSVIYGIEGGYRTGYTILMLRMLAEKHAGLDIRTAGQEPVYINMKDGSTATAMQNRLVAWKAPA